MLTTGTGSGKSLAYMIPIVDRVLAAKAAGTYRPGIKAIVVYPMNALANSQLRELQKFLTIGYPDGPPVTFDRYTGQESADDRARIIANPPDILLTNYVMLELVLTRPRDRGLIEAARGLWFLVLDELHTYRGRQGADVALLVRRLRDTCDAATVQCIGTSATMTTEGDAADQRRAVAEVATTLFGVPVQPGHVIGETLERITDPAAIAPDALRRRIGDPAPPEEFAAFTTDPLATWIEEVFGFEPGSPAASPQRRRRPPTLPEAARQLAEQTSTAAGGVRGSDQGRAAGRVADHQSRDGPPGVRVPAAPVPVQGRQRVRDAGAPGDPARHQHLSGHRAGRGQRPGSGACSWWQRCAAADLGADSVLPRVRPGLPGRHPERYRRRAPVCGSPG